MKNEIKGFTTEQGKEINEVSELHYNKISQGLAILTMYKEYLKNSDDKTQELFSIEMEKVIEVAIEKIEPTSSLLCEISVNSDYLINPH